MNKLLKKLPLSFKLLLLILLPLALIVYLSLSLYKAKSDKADFFHGYVNRINRSSMISDLITNLQEERRSSYAFALKKGEYDPQITEFRRTTDQSIAALNRYNDVSLSNFEKYTFLDSIEPMRKKIDKGIPADIIMHYYTTAIFRLNTLNLVSAGNNEYLNPVFDALTTEKILNEMVSYLGIIRANFYNALYSKNNNILMLYGLKGTYDVYNSYEKELLVKASPDMLQRYREMRNAGELKQTMDYIDHVFKKFSFDTLYNAEKWWKTSAEATFQLRDFKNDLLQYAKRKMNEVYLAEKRSRNNTIIVLVIALILVFGWMIYTSRILSESLKELDIAARKIAAGITGISPPVYSKDVIGNLGKSIAEIDEKNKVLAAAADTIGKGNFDTPVHPRSDADMLGNAVLRMRDNLREFTMEIEKTNETFKLIADAAPVMIWMSGKDKLCTFFNTGWLSFRGRSMNQELGNGWAEGVHAEDYDRCLTTYTSSFDSHHGFYMEYRLKRYDGQYRWISDTGVPRYSPDGEFDGFIGACIDIHEMKVHEQRKDDFITMASHELNTPVTSIKGHAQLLQNIYNDQADNPAALRAVAQTSLQSISRQTSKLAWLISELLDLSKMESGKFELYKTEFDPKELAEETVEEMRHITSGHDFVLHNDFKGKVCADRERIAQVLVNLLSNAVKYSPSSNKVEIFLRGDNENLFVSVKDYGIGIDKKDQPKIFERFYRVEGKNEQTYPGFGIGLFIASEIIRRHRGFLTVESEKGKGSVFTFKLPLHATNESELPATTSKDSFAI